LRSVSVKTLSCNGVITPDRSRVFENKMLRRIFGPKRDDVMEMIGIA
jgi:hypothetical protein